MNEQKQLPAQQFISKIGYCWDAEFNNELKFDNNQKTLGQHLFLKINQSFKELNEKWIDKGQNKKISWDNIDTNKLLIDSVHIINLGLDGLLKNHLHIIPFWNKSKGKYDINLMPGFMGKDFYRRKVAPIEPLNIIYELVFETDFFKAIKKDKDHKIETYEFCINEPFKRGKIIGGFGYIEFENQSLNKLITVSEDDFVRYSSKSKQKYFWDENPIEMRYKTIVHRTTEKLQEDPNKVNQSYFKIENEEFKGEDSEKIDNEKVELIDFDKESEKENEGGPGF